MGMQPPLPSNSRSEEPPLTPVRGDSLRSRRFAEVIDYALNVLGAESGTMLGSQRRLAESMGVSSTMLTRYKTNLVDFDNLKCATVRELARAIDLDIGTIFCWIDHGRDAAMARQRVITGKPFVFSPFDLVRELELSLKRVMPNVAPPESAAPQLQSAALLALIEQHRQDSPAIFDRLVRALDLQPLIDQLSQRTALEDEEWQQLAELLDATPEALQQQYGS